MKGYMTIAEASKKWGIDERRINTVCFKEAEIFDLTWAIPEEMEKPKDARTKSGKYIKSDK